MAHLRKFEHLKIPLADLLSATNNFSQEHRIGGGGFGSVYQGKLSSMGNATVAIKVLDIASSQGGTEFWKEVMMLSEYKHENIISLLGFCDEKGQKILVYNYVSGKSLDTHLENKELTWSRRLKICIGAAKGLAYLHDPAGTQRRLLHRDMKSSSILLDENWNAIISSFGLSKHGPANQENTFLITGTTAGTLGYVDPEYIEDGVLTKESDVYSFGVVLFEVLCGRLCILNIDGRQQSLTRLVRTHIKDKKNLNEIVWCNIKDEIHPNSLKVFAKIAFQCLKRSHERRPRMEVIVEELEKCLKYQQFAHLGIPLADILSATNNFSKEHRIGGGGSGQVFEGKLSSMENTTVAVKVFDRSFGPGDFEFWKEVMMLAEYKHGNIISLLGFCDENSEKILVYKYASRKSLDTHIANKELTWSLRLKICIDAAKGLAYLHNPPAGGQQRLLHGDIKSSNILLDENWNAIIADFGLSVNQKNTSTSSTAGSVGYVDPQYIEDRVLTKESDVYSFGVVLFEVLCGRLCIVNINGRQSSLTTLVRDKHIQNKLHEFVWSNIKDEIHPSSLKSFLAIAYQCLNKESYERPSIEEVGLALETSLTYQVSLTEEYDERPSTEDGVAAFETKSTANTKSFFVKEFEHLRIQLDEVALATNNFSKDHCIGGGGFGSVFEGKLILRGNTRVAIKRLDRSFGQGDSEFWKEVKTLSDYKHENIITLLGFCDEKDEKILIYKYASKKSLDKHLDNKELTWIQRLRICIGAAFGLSYLHNPAGTQQRLLHRDIKSSNILLDENWNARIADFGLSKFGPANQNKTYLITNIAGTLGYCDPQYIQDGVLTKESDVYSFGVVLFEVLCGRLCIVNNDKSQSLPKLVRRHIKCNKLNEIVWCNIKDEIHPNSLKMFSEIAYLCMKTDQEKRPKMEEIVLALEACLQFQEAFDKAQETKLKQKALGLDFKEICPPGGSDLVVLYTTSVKGIRKTSKDCLRVRSLLKSLKVSYQERDVSMHSEFRTELSQILSGPVALPRLFIKGEYIGGAEEIFLLHEQGKFRPLLAGVLLNKSEGACKRCAGVRSVVCRKCNGSNFLKSGDGKQTRCTECNKNGLITCPDCF